MAAQWFLSIIASKNVPIEHLLLVYEDRPSDCRALTNLENREEMFWLLDETPGLQRS